MLRGVKCREAENERNTEEKGHINTPDRLASTRRAAMRTLEVGGKEALLHRTFAS